MRTPTIFRTPLSSSDRSPKPKRGMHSFRAAGLPWVLCLFAAGQALGQSPELEIVWSNGWQVKFADSLEVNEPQHHVRVPLPGRRGQLAFAAVMGGFQQQPDDEELQPRRDPLLPVNHQDQEMAPVPLGNNARPDFPATTPSIFAKQLIGIAFLIAGVLGWLLLGVSVWLLESRLPPAKPS